MSEIFVNDFGTVIRANLNANITGNTLVRIDITKPDLTIIQKTATVEDVILGIVSITTVSGDINQTGKYCFVPFVKFATKEFRGKPKKITVTDPCA